MTQELPPPRPRDYSSFRDEEGRNRFADEPGTGRSEAESDPYSAPADTSELPYRAGGYVATLPGRGRLLLGVAALATLFCVAGLLMTPFAMISLAVSLPIWFMAYGDLKAMSAGAMQARDRRYTLAAFGLGLATSLAATARVVVGATSLWYDLTAEMNW